MSKLWLASQDRLRTDEHGTPNKPEPFRARAGGSLHIDACKCSTYSGLEEEPGVKTALASHAICPVKENDDWPIQDEHEDNRRTIKPVGFAPCRCAESLLRLLPRDGEGHIRAFQLPGPQRGGDDGHGAEKPAAITFSSLPSVRPEPVLASYLLSY